MSQVYLEPKRSAIIQEVPSHIQMTEWDGKTATEKTHAIGTSMIGSSPKVRSDLSYTIQIRNLIAQILHQLNEIAKNDRNSVEELKKKYFNATQEGADLGRTIGANNLKFAIFTLIAGAVLPNLVNNPIHKDIATSFARDFSPKIGEMFQASTGADKHKVDNLASMLVNQFQMEGQKGQNASTAKQELLGILRELLEALKSSTKG